MKLHELGFLHYRTGKPHDARKGFVFAMHEHTGAETAARLESLVDLQARRSNM